MYQFKKYLEGIALIDDDTGASRLLDETETGALRAAYPAIDDNKTVSWFTDSLPEGIRRPTPGKEQS